MHGGFMRRSVELSPNALLKEICDWYLHSLEISNEEVKCISDCGEVYTYPNVNTALKDWVPTLEESNKSCKQILWENFELEYIRSLN